MPGLTLLHHLRGLDTLLLQGPLPALIVSSFEGLRVSRSFNEIWIELYGLSLMQVGSGPKVKSLVDEGLLVDELLAMA